MEEQESTEEPRQAAKPAITPQQRKNVESVIAWMEETLGIDRNAIAADNDWTLIVRMHAMVETALNVSLVKQFDSPELSRVVAKLDTGNTATGKVAFAKALNILIPSSVVFIQKLSELRNFCVHDIRNFNFNIDDHLAKLEPDKRNELVKPLVNLLKPEHKKTTSIRETLYVGVLQVMMELYAHDLKCQARALTEEGDRLARGLYEKQQGPNPKIE